MLGRQLNQRNRPPTIVWGIAPTGVELAASASQALDCGFDVVIGAHVRLPDVGVVGAMAEDFDAVLDPAFKPKFDLIEMLDEALDRSRRAIKTERLLFRGQRPLRPVEGHTLFIVDGHVTSPWKLLAAAEAAQQMKPSHLVVAAAVSTRAVQERILARRFEFSCPSVLMDPAGHPRPFGDPQDPGAERLRSIVVARQAA